MSTEPTQGGHSIKVTGCFAWAIILVVLSLLMGTCRITCNVGDQDEQTTERD